MMPYIEEQQTSADMISEFRGYNHNPVIGDNEFFDMENMTSDKYPMASTRDKRGTLDLDLSEGETLIDVAGKDNVNVITRELYEGTELPENQVFYDITEDMREIDPSYEGSAPDGHGYEFAVKVPYTPDLGFFGSINESYKEWYQSTTGRYMTNGAGVHWHREKDLTPTVTPSKIYYNHNNYDYTFVNRSTQYAAAWSDSNNLYYLAEPTSRAITTGKLFTYEERGDSRRIETSTGIVFATKALLTEVEFDEARATVASTTRDIKDGLVTIGHDTVHTEAFSDGTVKFGDLIYRFDTYEEYVAAMTEAGLKDAYKIRLRSTYVPWGYTEDGKTDDLYQVLSNRALCSDEAYYDKNSDINSYFDSNGDWINPDEYSQPSVGGGESSVVVGDQTGNAPAVLHPLTFESSSRDVYVFARHKEYKMPGLVGKNIRIGTCSETYNTESHSGYTENDHICILSPKLKIVACSPATLYQYKTSTGRRHFAYETYYYNGSSGGTASFSPAYVSVPGEDEHTYYEYDIYVTPSDAEQVIVVGGTGYKFKTLTGAAMQSIVSSYKGVDFSDCLRAYICVGEADSELTFPKINTHDPDYPTIDKLYVSEYDIDTQTRSHKTEICDTGEGTRQLIEMGANLILLPEKYQINTIKKDASHYTDIHPLEAVYDGIVRETYNVTVKSASATVPDNPEEYTSQVWWDTENKVAKKYSMQTNMWATVPVKKTLEFDNGNTFKEGDAIRFYGDAPNYLITSAGAGYITFVVTDEQPSNTEYRYHTRITRQMPQMDYVIECQNRLWGCRYGEANNGQTVNEIFASKLGDPSNWYSFANTASDSYYVNLGDKGEFTGAVKYQDNPVFFRADKIHRVSGSYPANYQVRNIDGYGVKPGCYESISVMNDIVYYLSPMGMVMFNGGIPVSLAEAFGDIKYKKCISGDVGNKLYCSMQDEDNNWTLFVFDDSKGFWHKEDDLQAVGFCNYADELFAIKTGELVSLTGVYGDEEDDFDWMLRTGEIGYNSPMRKRLNKIVSRIKLAISSRATIEIMYDQDGIWRHINEVRPIGKPKSYAVPVIPHRCDHFAVRIRGKGAFDLQSLTRFWHEGSEKD